MDFKLITDAEGSYDNFTGEAKYKVSDSGVLTITDGRTRRIYGIGSWLRIEDKVAPSKQPKVVVLS